MGFPLVFDRGFFLIFMAIAMAVRTWPIAVLFGAVDIAMLSVLQLDSGRAVRCCCLL